MLYDQIRDNEAVFNLTADYLCIIVRESALCKLAKIIPINIQRLNSGDAIDVVLLSKDIKIAVYCTALLREQQLLLIIPSDTYTFCMEKLSEILNKDEYFSEEINLYLFEGPKSAKIVAQLINTDIRPLEYYNFINFTMEGETEPENICLRSSFFGELGYLLITKRQLNTELLQNLGINFWDFNDPEVAVLVNETNTRVWNKSVFLGDCPIETGLGHIFDYEDDEYELHDELNSLRHEVGTRVVAVVFDDSSVNKAAQGSAGEINAYVENKMICKRKFYSKRLDQTIGYASVSINDSFLGHKIYCKDNGTLTVHKTPFFITNSNNLIISK